MSARLKGVGMEDEFAVTAAFRDGCQVLTTSGELDIHTAPKLRAALDGDVDGLPVIVDLTALTFIDSSGLHTLLRNHQDGRLAALVSAPDSNVQRVLDLVEAHKTIAIYDDLTTAIQSIPAQPQTA